MKAVLIPPFTVSKTLDASGRILSVGTTNIRTATVSKILNSREADSLVDNFCAAILRLIALRRKQLESPPLLSLTLQAKLEGLEWE